MTSSGMSAKTAILATLHLDPKLPSFNTHFYDLLLVQLQDQSEPNLLLYVVDAFYLFVWLFICFFLPSLDAKDDAFGLLSVKYARS